MGKKLKKGKQPRKPNQRQVASSPRAADLRKSPMLEQIGAEGVVDGVPCEHYEKDSAVFQQILSRIQTSDRDAACEDCRDEPTAQRGGRGKNKANRKKGGATPTEDVIWVCLNCIHFGCGGGLKDLMPYGHARRHAKQENHSLAVRLDNVVTCFCFLCNSLIPIKMPEGADSSLPSEGHRVASISDLDNEPKSDNASAEIAGKGYAVRGLVNLGNTCFFNSIMQNLLSMGILREYFSNLTETIGPLTMSLKKLFVETGINAESNRGIVNPKNFFGCICSKAPQFKGYQQQDSHEVLHCLLDGLCTEEKNSKKHSRSLDDPKSDKLVSTTFVDVIFGGQLSSTVCCKECGHTSIVYEPFLDLSLPVPSKKPTQKKFSASMAKRSKFPARQDMRVRRARERGASRLPHVASSKTENDDCAVDSEQIKLETADLLPESSGSYCTACPPQDQEQTSALASGDDFGWLDFVELPTTSNSQNVTEAATSPQHSSESYCTPLQDPAETSAVAVVDESCSNVVGPSSQSNIDLNGEKIEHQEVICFKDSKSPQELLKDESSSELATDLSEKEPVGITANAETEDGSSQRQNTNVLLRVNSTSSIVGHESAEDESDILGDLFAEPEVDSSAVVPKSVGENNTSWLEGTGSESNLEEVDHSDEPVSVARCLAYFTKPELLSDEHAWHCENCSKILRRQMLEKSERKQHVDKDGTSEAVESISLYDQPLSDNGKPCLVAREHCNVDSNGDVNFQASNFTDSISSLPDHNSDCKNICSENSERDIDSSFTSDSNYLSCASTSPSTPELSHVNTGPTITTEETLCSNGEFDDGALPNGGIKVIPQRKKQTAKGTQQTNNSTNSENGNEDAKVKRDATKRILINKIPPILTIHLKRFNQDARGRLNKLKGHVSFQEVIDLTPYIDPRCRSGANNCYRLIGVVEHSGGMGGGHYVAYVRGRKATGKAVKDGSCSNDRWFYASDAHVRETSLSEVLQSEAYILFYEQIQQ